MMASIFTVCKMIPGEIQFMYLCRVRWTKQRRQKMPSFIRAKDGIFFPASGAG
jgi:hypothetical protein